MGRGGGGGQVKFYPIKRGGGGISFSHAEGEGDRKKIGVVFLRKL